MSRVVKHVGSRSVPEDDTKVLMAVPFGPGEKIVSVNLDCYFASGDASAIDQPSQCNWYGITIPWSLVFATELLKAGGAPSTLPSVASIDAIYAQWLKDVTDDAAEVFGGDVDTDPETTSTEEDHATEELLDSGPIGVHKWFSREVIMRPFAAEGNTVIRFGDDFRTSVHGVPSASMGGLLLFGMVRFQTDAETNFNIELDDTTSRANMGLLIAGDYAKIDAKIKGDTGSGGDFIRTVLFGGDNYIEADTLKGAAGKASAKASFFIQSPISRFQR